MNNQNNFDFNPRFLLSVVVCFGILFSFVISTLYVLSVLNTEARLRTQITARQEANKPSFDTMWKILSQKAGVTAQYKKDFQEIWPDLIKGRYSEGSGKMMLWIQERNPTFDSSLYKDLMASIESERKRFLRDQEQLIDYKREHDLLLNQQPSGLVCSVFGRDEVEIKIVTSENTDMAFASGREDDVDLFKDK